MTAKRRSSNVPGQYLGYSLQTTRALVLLLSAAPGSFVSVEVLDDVAVASSSGSSKLVQTKSVSSRANPIADRSPELWKTLANWVRGVRAGDIDLAHTDLEIFVSKTRAGALARLFDAATDQGEAEAALNAAEKVLENAPGTRRSARRKSPDTLQPHVEEVFSDRTTAAAVVARVRLAFGSGSSGHDVVASLRSKLISEPMLDLVAKQMLGWVKQSLDDLIEQGRPAVISTDRFNVELGAFVRRVDRAEILNCFAPPPTQEAVDLELKDRVYVQQLDLIGVDFDTKLAAARDYLRASVNRSVWASKGLVHRAGFDEFEEKLARTWRAKRDVLRVTATNHSPEQQGLLLYSECSQVDVPLEGRPLPSHFVPGCYHAMAETLDVGWHPDYKRQVSSRPTEGGGPKEDEA